MTKSESPSSFRFSSTAKSLLERLSNHLGISKTAVLEMAIRYLAQREAMHKLFSDDNYKENYAETNR